MSQDHRSPSLVALVACVACVTVGTVGCQPRAGVDRGVARDIDAIDGEVEVVVRDATTADRLEALVGREVRVQFRRDALGLSATSPVPPTAERAGVRTVFLDGELTAVTSDWIALRTDRVTYWIPREGLLLLEVPNQ